MDSPPARPAGPSRDRAAPVLAGPRGPAAAVRAGVRPPTAARAATVWTWGAVFLALPRGAYAAHATGSHVSLRGIRAPRRRESRRRCRGGLPAKAPTPRSRRPSGWAGCRSPDRLPRRSGSPAAGGPGVVRALAAAGRVPGHGLPRRRRGGAGCRRARPGSPRAVRRRGDGVTGDDVVVLPAWPVVVVAAIAIATLYALVPAGPVPVGGAGRPSPSSIAR